MASPSDFSLDLKPQSFSMLLKSFASSGEHQLTEPKQLEDFLACLEDERLKIEAFKRELPLCMQLLSNVVEISRQKLHSLKSSNQGSRPVLEEFIPIKIPTADGDKQDLDSATKTDKSNWMLSAQLWSQTPNTDNNSILTNQYGDQKDHMGLHINLSTLDCLQRTPNPAGTITPFSKDRTLPAPITNMSLTNNKNEHYYQLEEKKLLGSELMPDYCPSNMITGGGMIENEGLTTAGDQTLTTLISNTNTHNNSNNTNNNNSSNNQQSHRKARRCWSPDLHRKFVNALQMLGGSQVATPKQIRELMKVEGLTNDEVKSHLQKYRLHTRRPSPSPPTSTGTATAAQLVVLGGIWVPQEYAANHYQHVGPQFYNAAGQQMFQIHQHQQQHMQMQAVQVYKKKQASSRTQHSSPDQSDTGRGASESGSWKGGEISVEERRSAE